MIRNSLLLSQNELRVMTLGKIDDIVQNAEVLTKKQIVYLLREFKKFIKEY